MTQSLAFNLSTSGGHDLFKSLIQACELHLGPDYCLIGGLALNSYLEPMHTLDADFVIAASKLDLFTTFLANEGFRIEVHPYSVNAFAPNSDLRVLFSKMSVYADFPSRAQPREVFGVLSRVASLPDLINGKTWAWMDKTRRPSKRAKDQADLLRIAESFPELLHLLPPSLQKLITDHETQ